MACNICSNTEETRHINLYVSGSEGLIICHPCEMSLVQHVRDVMNIAGRAKLSMVREKKKKKRGEAIQESRL